MDIYGPLPVVALFFGHIWAITSELVKYENTARKDKIKDKVLYYFSLNALLFNKFI